MLAESQRKALAAVLVAAFVAAVVLGAAAGALRPASDVANGGQVVGETAFAYLGGLRRFAAAVLWNRIDPQYHTYYEGEDLARMTFMLPTIRLVQTLDPQFQQAYYVGAWIVARRGDVGTGIGIARDGVRANPSAGLMYANLIELLTFEAQAKKNPAPHLAEEVKLAEKGLGQGVEWDSDSDRFESYAVFQGVFERAGMKAQAEAVKAELTRMSGQGVVPNVEQELQERSNQKGGN